jgi:2-oxoglutarate ferredoxin oxidoreductase subunit alpha
LKQGVGGVTSNRMSWRIGGQAGDGIDATGEILAVSMARLGLHIFTYRVYPSRIRGGHTSYEVRVSDVPILCRSNEIDYLVALDQETIDVNVSELSKNGVLMHDSSFKPVLPEGIQFSVHGIPFVDLAQESGGRIMKNMVALGATAGLLGFKLEAFNEALEDRFLKKGQKVIDKNIVALEKGSGFIRDSIEKKDAFRIESDKLVKTARADRRLLMNGNQCLAFGALVGGCRFFSGYPITPATEIMEWLAMKLPEHGGIMVQSEDEIAAINMAIGAGYAGARSMTATSGPGLALMTEAISMAGMSETPVVIVDSQRAGPSTGLPTKHEQSDLLHITMGSHGDFPRLVLYPGSADECFYDIVKAFNLAEKYQCPVFVLSDESMSANKQTMDDLDMGRAEVTRHLLTQEELDKFETGEFKRYLITEDGISKRSLPSMANGDYTSESNEHDEYGSISEDIPNRVQMMDKRLRKLDTASEELREGSTITYGKVESDMGLIGIGSTKGAILEAMEILESNGINAKFLQIRVLWPFPKEPIGQFIDSCSKVAVIEHNATGQLARLIRSELSTADLANILKYDGTPFKPNEISMKIKEVAA